MYLRRALFTIRVFRLLITSVGSVCPSVCLPVQAITFEPLKLENSFSVCRYILTISRSSLSIKVIGSRSRSHEKLAYFYKTVTSVCFYFNKTFLKRSRSSEVQGYLVSRSSERKSIFCLFVNVFLISVLCR